MHAAPQPSVPASSADGSADAAWVRIETRCDPGTVRELLADLEQIYRVNPLLEIAAFEPGPDGVVRFRARNLENGRDIDTIVHIDREGDRATLRFEHGLKRRTHLCLEPLRSGSALTITDEYGGVSEPERAARIGEADRSLVPWGHALRLHLDRWHRWGRFAAWRWLVRRLWLPMRPSSRRIVWLIVVISLFEFAAFLVVVAFWRLA